MHEELKEQGIILQLKPHQETGAVVSIFAEKSGILTGYVHAVHSRKNVQYYQLGNLIDFTYTRKKAFDFGTIIAHSGVPLWYLLQDHQIAFYAFTALCDILWACLGKDMPEETIYHGFLGWLSGLQKNDHMLEDTEIIKKTCHFLLFLLTELGFSPDIYRCCVTQKTDYLIYLSPKTGRAVCADAGKPYASKLWMLPLFLHKPEAYATDEDVKNGLKICGFLLEKHLFFPQEKYIPASLMRLYDLI